MHIVKLIPASLAAALGACVIAPFSPERAPPVMAAQVTVVEEARISFIGITGELPEAGNDLPPALFDPLIDLVPVRLDLTLRPPLELSLIGEDGLYGPLPDCGFGPVDAREVAVPTGSNHMLMSVRMGSPVDHPANLLSCDYDPAELTDESPGVVVRLRGCFLPQSVSIPTAVQWVLNPLPASACGLGD
ncbi:MAG: hypothetical protein FP825_01160 [Hyphomonas sp.]|uniref:hypothetical protein n=1 Tax=Hyphomonas sp. TaxID=87 RepID=UPI00184CA1BC|nr:hypothetical protein [Hyphomonas sp.]MBU3919919.1 hypothetical protein [Alphaproteobacteria bacterium]MBA3067072.1 hypothetical protein [Hyphomonas sp.]MBU4063133.1 hypothetical protein [Alphaproteobacteria bacterium]MBU4164450.1 hypothetical protein [Alphaproteobacteria bacterium]MBU4569245.1 hypothetical protein [Alphaproteobacteria bacterium]